MGDAIADVIARGVVKREDLWVTSKLWTANAYPDRVGPALDKTLADLKLTYLVRSRVCGEEWPRVPPPSAYHSRLAAYLQPSRACPHPPSRVTRISTSSTGPTRWRPAPRCSPRPWRSAAASSRRRTSRCGTSWKRRWTPAR